MVEETARDRRALGAGVGVFTVIGAIVVSCGSLLFVVGAMSENKYEAGGLGLVAAALGFGFAANAIWRQ